MKHHQSPENNFHNLSVIGITIVIIAIHRYSTTIKRSHSFKFYDFQGVVQVSCFHETVPHRDQISKSKYDLDVTFYTVIHLLKI